MAPADQVPAERSAQSSRLHGRVAVVTGAGRGIGRAIAQRLASEGAMVLATDIDGDAAKSCSQSIDEAGGVAAAASVDITDRAQLRAIPDYTEQSFRSAPHIVVCNAGVQSFGRAAELPAADWDDVMGVNGRGTFFTLQMAAAALPEQVDANVVTVASIQGRLAGPFYPHYSASKAAVLSLTKSFAAALAPRGIRVNAVAPGVIQTELWDRADAEIAELRGVAAGVPRSERVAAVPLGRAGTVDDVAAAVAFLVSPDASYITGECIHVCGGDVML